ncbi:MAG TPA: UbiA family prenyltransferase [Bacteroidia bacterium]|jgi:1,4-dihydroxy-2-naphthoate octaprenyltransferase|nr:UbiA family prenyltransferase [Bacteroidia bacterium]
MTLKSPLYFLDKSTIKHLRLPFSFHLMPVFLFALSQAKAINWPDAILAFIVLHLFVYPASNGYNSYQDKDETSIGGLKYPPRVTKNLFYVTLLFDLVGFTLSFFISISFACSVLIYVLISRAYSYRKLRLKKYAVIGFLTVFLFQGAFTYFMTSVGVSNETIQQLFAPDHLICMAVSSLFIGSVYPLTQIYQHESDKKDGVITLSYKLGYIGTFVFSALLFTLATGLLFYYFDSKKQLIALFLFFIIMFPVMLRLLIWFRTVKQNTTAASFENTMRMNLLASSCMNFYFVILICNNFWAWF